MDKEYSLLIELCRHYVLNEKFTFPQGADCKRLFKAARAHNLAGICHCALNNAENKDDVPQDAANAFSGIFLDTVFLYGKQSISLQKTENLLQSAQMPYIVFKGARLRELYPVPESRMMGDIDILIKKSDRDRVKKLLTQNGYACEKQNGPVYNYTENGVLTEVHTELTADYPAPCFQNPFDYAEFDGCCGTFDDSYHFAYLIAHTAHHFKFYGAGIKHILDLAVFLHTRNIDEGKTFEYLREAGLEQFGKNILSVCAKWFGVGRIYTDGTLKTEEFLCKSGAFGGENKNKGVAVVRKELESGRKYLPFMIKLRLAFPPYSKLRKIDYIKFIDGRRWLTPYAWIYRIIYNLRHKKEFMANAVGNISDENTKKEAYAELEFFKEIGLE